jgi:nitrate reductase gamma subunit
MKWRKPSRRRVKVDFLYSFIDKFYYFVMVPMLYAAIFIFIAGIISRLIKIGLTPNPKGTTLRVFPKKRSRLLAILSDIFLFPGVTRRTAPVYWVFFVFFHIAIFFLFLGHLELIANIQVIQLVRHKIFLGKGLVGLLLVVSLFFFLFRRFRSPYRELSVPEDFILILGLLVTSFFGAHMNLATLYSSYGFDIPLEAYRTYLGSMIRFHPTIPAEISGSPHQVILVMHVLLANIFFIYFPFSKVMHSILAFFSNAVKRS